LVLTKPLLPEERANVPMSRFQGPLPENAFVADARGSIPQATRRTVVDIPNGYTSDVVSYQQTRVAHRDGMADSQPGGLLAGGMAD
jgi:hypothetical protein